MMHAPSELRESIAASREMLQRYVSGRIADPTVVADIVQETLASALRHAAQLRDAGKLQPWLRKIALNELRRWFNERRDHHWTELAERAATPKARRSAFEAIDAVCRDIQGLPLDRRTMTVLALAVGMNWRPGEIAAVIGIKPRLVTHLLAKARRQAARRAAPPDARMFPSAKASIAYYLFLAGQSGLSGDGVRNLNLMRESYAFVRLVLLQHPDSADVCAMAVWIGYCLARQTEYAGNETSFVRFRDWRPERWDQNVLREANANYRRFQTMEAPEYTRLGLETYHLMYTSPHALDFPRLFRNFDRMLRLSPYSYGYLDYAALLQERDGPLAAAAYLERFKNNAALRQYPRTYFFLAKFNDAAGQWEKARRYYKKYLRWKSSPGLRRHVQERIAECSRQLKAAAPAVRRRSK